MAEPDASVKIEVSTAAFALVGATVAVAIAIGFFAGPPTAFLVLVTGALLGAILLVWHSLRTLAGDAEVDPALDAATMRVPSYLTARKQRALRALKDIEQEHAIGKIDAADFKALDAEYRARAKEVIREMDDAIEPFRDKAEALVRAHLEKQAHATPTTTPTTNVCAACETDNDLDATFCKKCGKKIEAA